VSETSQELHKLDRDGLIDLIGKRITQAIVLLNHLKGGRQPFESYVAEKLITYPILDQFNGEMFEHIAFRFEVTYGIDIRPSWVK